MLIFTEYKMNLHQYQLIIVHILLKIKVLFRLKKKLNKPYGKFETIIFTCDIFIFIKYKTASSRVNLVKSILFTLNILSAINNPDLYATLFGWISQINKPYLFPPANRIPILDVSVKNEIYRVPVLN